MISVWPPGSYLPFKQKAIIKYLSAALDYNQYCDLGKNNLIAKPSSCPHCKSSSCLIGHGWYARKGLSGASCGYRPFWIRRFYCKVTRKTVTMHPCFSHTRKRYILQHVIQCFIHILENIITVSQTALNLQVPRQTLKRWLHSFATMHGEAKRICYRLTGPPQDCLGQQILSYFCAVETGTLLENVVRGMVCLSEEFFSPLY